MLNWDLSTGAPPKAIGVRSEVISTLSSEQYKLSTSDEMADILFELSKPDNMKHLNFILRRSLEEDNKNYLRLMSISPESYRDYINIKTQAQSVWKNAKFKKDYSLLKPYLKKIVEYKRQVVKTSGYKGHPYNFLLDEYEPGMTVEKLDKIFYSLKENIMGILDNVEISEYPTKAKNSIFTQEFDVTKQESVILKLLNNMGFCMSKGRLDHSPHPFALRLNSGDVRLTINKFHPLKFKGALFAALHEGGHGLYNQNIGRELENTPLFVGASHGVHESQSRFWENIVGRSLDFWYYFKQELSNDFPSQMKGISPEEIYLDVNKLNNSKIRTSSDELSYNLHIIMRYELEKSLIAGELEVDDLPKAWSEKTKEYLGFLPKDDGEGILQDIHWAKGYFGYFPAYALGNIYAAQLTEKVKIDIPDISSKIRRGEFTHITNWMIDNIYTYGKLLPPGELIKEVTGEEVNVKAFTNYLANKYSEIF